MIVHETAIHQMTVEFNQSANTSTFHDQEIFSDLYYFS